MNLKLIHRFPLLAFCILTFVLSWGIWLPLTLLGGDMPSTSFFVMGFVGQLAPGLAAVIVTMILDGKTGLRQLLGRFLLWRFSPFWYVCALSTGPVIYLLALWLASMLKYISIGQSFNPSGLQIIVLLSYVLGAAGRELGWRGFALLHLQERFSSLISSVIVGIIWACWYAFGYFWKSPLMAASMPFSLLMLNTIAISILIMLVFNNTHSSLLVATLFHGCLNIAAHFLLPVPPAVPELAPIRSGLLVVIAIIAFFILGRQKSP